MVYIPTDTPLEQINFPFASMYQSQIVSWGGEERTMSEFFSYQFQDFINLELVKVLHKLPQSP